MSVAQLTSEQNLQILNKPSEEQGGIFEVKVCRRAINSA